MSTIWAHRPETPSPSTPPPSPDASHDRGTHTPDTEATVMPGHSISIHTGGTSGWQRALPRRAVVPASSRDGMNRCFPGAHVVGAPSLTTSAVEWIACPGPRSTSTLTLRRGPGPGSKDKKERDNAFLTPMRAIPPKNPVDPQDSGLDLDQWEFREDHHAPSRPFVFPPHTHSTVGEQDPDRPPRGPQASEHLSLTRWTKPKPTTKNKGKRRRGPGKPDTPPRRGQG